MRRKSPLPPSPRVTYPDPLRPRFVPVDPPQKTRYKITKRVVTVTRPTPRPLQQVEDRRHWHPLGKAAPAGVIGRRAARAIIEKPRSNPYRDPFPSLKLGFAVPSKVALCVRRKTRREVIHATGQTRKGAGARRRRNPYSNVEC